VVIECSNQNPKIEVLNPIPGTGKAKNDKKRKFTFAVAQQSIGRMLKS
jgi:hypothetical protein